MCGSCVISGGVWESVSGCGRSVGYCVVSLYGCLQVVPWEAGRGTSGSREAIDRL